MPDPAHRVGLVGARGYVGGELIRLLLKHPQLDLAFASSRKLAGQPLRCLADDLPDAYHFELLDAAAVAQRASKETSAVFLALPNNLSEPYVEAINAVAPDCVIIDLSADHRFDASWAYGLPEHHRESLRHAKRIANPGCYATAAQIALRPLIAELSAAPQIFGVSG